MTDNAKLAECLSSNFAGLPDFLTVDEWASIIAALRKDAAGQVLDGASVKDAPVASESPAPAAPTLAELDKAAWTTGYMASRFREALVSAYRSGKLREVGDGEVVVPREPTEAMLSADAPPGQMDEREGEPLNWKFRRAIYRAMLAAKDAS